MAFSVHCNDLVTASHPQGRSTRTLRDDHTEEAGLVAAGGLEDTGFRGAPRPAPLLQSHATWHSVRRKVRVRPESAAAEGGMVVVFPLLPVTSVGCGVVTEKVAR